MTQEIIVYIILGIVTLYVVFTFLKKPEAKKPAACDGCSGCDLKKDLTCNLPATSDPRMESTPHPPGGAKKSR
jgi:hypothetical protein